jgi:4-hydroxybenzoyl-CoA reductase subunit beta
MILPAFQYHQPQTIAEAVAIANSCNGDFDFVSGGTDLLPNYKDRLNPRSNVISLSGVKELYEISPTKIGAMARLVEIENSRLLRERLPVLPAAAATIATPLIRESGTVGGNIMLDTRCFYFNQSLFWRDSKDYCLKADGNVCLVVPQEKICYATYSGDLAPVFMALGATFVLEGPDGKREVPSAKFFTHDGITRNVKLPEEILTHVIIPSKAQTLRASYMKLRVRDSMDFPVMGVAVAIDLTERTIEYLRVALTGVATTPLLFDEITDGLAGDQLTEDLIDDVSEDIMNRVTPYRNVAYSPQYRKAMIGVYLKRMMRGFLPPAQSFRAE